MLHYYPTKHVHRSPHSCLSVDVDERMSSNDHGEHSRQGSKGKCCFLTWRKCIPCCFKSRTIEGDDSYGPYDSSRRPTDQVPNYQSRSAPTHIESYRHTKKRWNDSKSGFSQSCPSEVIHEQHIHSQNYQRTYGSPNTRPAHMSPSRYASQVPSYGGQQTAFPIRRELEKRHVHEGYPDISRKQAAEARRRPDHEGSWSLPPALVESQVLHRSPTREEPPTMSIVSRGIRSQSRVNSEYTPKGQLPIDDESSLAVYRDISAVRSSTYIPREVSPGSQTLLEPRAVTQDVASKVHPSRPSFTPHKFDCMPLQSRVRFVGKDERFVGGTVSWTGFRLNNFDNKLAVIRLDQFSADAGNGIFYNEQLVRQIENNLYLLMDFRKLFLINLKEGDYCFVFYGPKDSTNRRGFLRNQSQITYELHPFDTFYTEPLTNISRFPDYFLEKIPTPVSDDVSDIVGPITLRDFNNFLGRNKGIQGKFNSCYLDTLLFSVFAFSAVLDDFLFNSEHQVASHLRHSIILPLRTCHFVADAHVEYLRKALSKATKNPKFETEARDIPECLEALFGSVLQVPAPLHVGSANFFNPTFAIETLTPDYIRVPTFQDFLDHSSVLMNFYFREVPKYFFLQFPREVYHSSIVIPSLELELNNILYRSVKECFSCGRNATLQFPQLAADSGLAKSFLCRSCASNHDLNEAAARQLPEPPVPDGEEPDTRLMLTAVLCIERSHYNCFARCADRWVFFDSMSDQEELFDHLQSTGSAKVNQLKKFNIPSVKLVPEFDQWIHQSEEEFKKDGLKSFLEPLPEKEQVHRLFSYAYMCLYTMNTS